MRTIKFRAWDTRFNDMHYYADVRTWHLNTPDLEECTLMQYTGLLDKNGKEIYEGDIVLWGGIHNRVVKWEPYGYSPWACDGEGDHDCHAGWHVESEIIGNIYDNPELIK
jgi:hypothetical protein